jgi:hypothetical protein
MDPMSDSTVKVIPLVRIEHSSPEGTTVHEPGPQAEAFAVSAEEAERLLAHVPPSVKLAGEAAPAKLTPARKPANPQAAAGEKSKRELPLAMRSHADLSAIATTLGIDAAQYPKRGDLAKAITEQQKAAADAPPAGDNPSLVS